MSEVSGAEQPYPQVPSQPDFPRLEERILERWAKEQTFFESIARREAQGADEFVFYDGPPFANGLPHYGHLLTGFVKDAVPRYRTMRGQVVFRRFGWDCHGLPAEVEAEKELGIAGHPAITAFGIGNFNDVCRTSVLRYTDEWQRYVERQARWVDFDHDYKTLDLDYMESVMWAFKSLWDRGLIYEGFRVLAYCWRCETPLSNTETRMDDVYQDRQDPALTVEFELLDDASGHAAVIACWRGRRRLGRCRPTWRSPWRRTSSTWSSNATAGATCWRSRASRPTRPSSATPAPSPGYAAPTSSAGATGPCSTSSPMPRCTGRARPSRCSAAEFVSTEEGTGIVHLAPGFGEDDQVAANAVGIPTIVPMDEHGRYTAAVAPWTGMHVFDANASRDP